MIVTGLEGKSAAQAGPTARNKQPTNSPTTFSIAGYISSSSLFAIYAIRSENKKRHPNPDVLLPLRTDGLQGIFL